MKNSRNIDDLRADVASVCREVIRRAAAKGIPILITNTVRDDEYQAVLYAQGRTKPGAIVTNAKKPTFHWDRARLAFDFCPTDEKGNCLWGRSDLFRAVGQLGKELGLTWGGDWKSIIDMPHLQWDAHGKYSGSMIRAGKRPQVLKLEKEEKELTEAEVRKLVSELLAAKTHPAPDSVPSKWAEEAVLWAKEAGIMEGDRNGDLRLRSDVTREELAVVIHRLAERMEQLWMETIQNLEITVKK